MITITEINGTNSDELSTYEITIKQDEKKLIDVSAYPLCECPEDAILERDLSYVWDIKEAFKIGYEAGKNGVEVQYIEKDENEK